MNAVLILDNHFRTRDELFRGHVYEELAGVCEIHGGRDEPMARSEIADLLPDAAFYVAAQPELSAIEVAQAANLKATIEVSGAFREGLDYAACFDHGVEVLSCSPGFRNSVAEMTLAMMLAGGRGLVAEHEAFRDGNERWLDDRSATDFSLYRQTVGFIGYGEISREIHRLIAPFAPKVLAYDPYLVADQAEVVSVGLPELVAKSRVVIVAAVPSEDTRGLLSAELIAQLQPAALVVVISRAWCTDFPALIAAAQSGQIQLATDVFPDEPLGSQDPLRASKNVILSPHRAAAVRGGRQLIGDMILHDVQAMLNGSDKRQLKRADPKMVEGLVSAQLKMPSMPNT